MIGTVWFKEGYKQEAVQKRGNMEQGMRIKTGENLALTIIIGISSVGIAMVFITGMVFDMMDMAGIRHNLLSYLFSGLSGIMFATMMLFLVTCINALVIMLVNTEFSMRNLFCVVYNYYGKNILLNTILIYLFYQGTETNKILLYGFYILFLILFFVQFYCRLIHCAGVEKKAAKLLLGITIGINVGIGFFTLLK